MSVVIIVGGGDAKTRIDTIVDASPRMSQERFAQAQALIDAINNDLHEFLGTSDPVS